jgi:ATP-dependent Clp protease adaptor protein ClpS
MAHTRAIAHEELTALRGPGKYHVIMLNDDTTPMDFVVSVLMNIFNKSEDDAHTTMIQIHEKGRAIAGTYTYEVAEQKSVETVSEARNHGFPLDVSVEEE